MHPHKPPDRLKHHGPGSDYEQAHAHLLGLLDGLEAAPDAAAAAPHIVELTNALQAHFAEEEAHDGVFTWLAAIDSTLGPELRELEVEHGRLLAELGGLAEAAAGDAFVAAVKAFTGRLRGHEQRERELLAKALDD